jgi:PIN domain nuclease of toxin-antitoxin system
LLSVVSAAEIAIKNGIGKLALQREDLDLICSKASIASYPLQSQHTAQLWFAVAPQGCV